MEEKLTITIKKADKYLDIHMDGECFDETLQHALTSIVKSFVRDQAFTMQEFIMALLEPEDSETIEESGTITSIQIPNGEEEKSK